MKCWKKKLKITSCYSRHFTIGCSWFPDRLRKGLLTNILFNFPNVITEFGTFAKTNTRKKVTKYFIYEKTQLLKRSDQTVSRLAHRRFSQKRNKPICCFCIFTLHSKKKTNSFVRFLGESTAPKSVYDFI